jgi:hypothetical protein
VPAFLQFYRRLTYLFVVRFCRDSLKPPPSTGELAPPREAATPVAPLPSPLPTFLVESPLLHLARRRPVTSFMTPVKTERRSDQCPTAGRRATTPAPCVVTAPWGCVDRTAGMGRPGRFGLGLSQQGEVLGRIAAYYCSSYIQFPNFISF